MARSAEQQAREADLSGRVGRARHGIAVAHNVRASAKGIEYILSETG